MPRIIGLTGGIASGKSLVSRTLKGLRMTVIDADDISHEILAKDTSIRQEVVRTFGTEVLNEEGEIDRGRLGRIVFSQKPELRKDLEAILHPPIREEMWKRARESRSNNDVVLDIPLLIETGAHERVDLVVVVYATRELQIQRLMARDGISRQEAMRRIDTQLPLEEKISSAHYIINNTGSVEETEEQVIRFYQVIREKEKP
jgi:dephospho-CoA kinase